MLILFSEVQFLTDFHNLPFREGRAE